MKQFITAIFVLLALTLATTAQTGKGKGRHQKHKQQLAQQLNLTDAQKATAKQYREDMKAQRLALEKNDGITVKEYREKKAALKKAGHEKMQSLLTAEQKTKLAGMKQEKTARHQQRQAQKMEKLKTKINLTDDQMAKIKSKRDANLLQVKQLKENAQMGPVEKKEQIMALKKQNRENFLSLLTPEQKTRFEELKKNHHRKSVK